MPRRASALAIICVAASAGAVSCAILSGPQTEVKELPRRDWSTIPCAVVVAPPSAGAENITVENTEEVVEEEKDEIEAAENVGGLREPDFIVRRALVTAYCPCARCCRRMTGITASGGSAWTKGIASDWRAIPEGTFVEIEGYGKFTIDDTGGAMRRSWRKRGILHLDVRMTYHWEARDWGEQWLYVKIFKK